MGAMFAVTVVRGAKAEHGIGFIDGWHHLIQPPFEGKGTGEVFCCRCSNSSAGTFCVLVIDGCCALLLVLFGLGLLEVFRL